MANDTTTRLWALDTVEAVKAVGNTIRVRHLHFEPTTAADVVRVSEYAADGTTAQTVLRAKCGAAVVPVDIPYDPPVVMNGMYLSELTHGVVYLLIESVTPVITA